MDRRTPLPQPRRSQPQPKPTQHPLSHQLTTTLHEDLYTTSRDLTRLGPGRQDADGTTPVATGALRCGHAPMRSCTTRACGGVCGTGQIRLRTALLHRGRRGCQSSCGSPPRRLLHHHQRPVFCVSVLQVGVDSVGVGGGGAGPGPLYLVGGDLSFDGSGLGLALGWWQSFVLVAFSGSFVHRCRRSPAFASSGHRLIERGRGRGSLVILAQLVARSLDALVEGVPPTKWGER